VTPSPPDSPAASTPPSAVDPLDRYLGELAQSADASYSAASRSLSIRPAELDSAVLAFDRTGVAPVLVTPRHWDLGFRPGTVRYNRVEGLNVMPRVDIEAPTSPRLGAFASAGYGTASEEATWRGGVRVATSGEGRRLALEVGHRRDVLAYGSGRRAGNSWTALVLGRDDADYHRAEGWNVRLRADAPRGRLELGYLAERQTSMNRETRFHLAGGSTFRVNPPIDDGRLRELRASLRLRLVGWSSLAARLDGALAGGRLGGDFAFDAFRLSLEGRRHLPWGDELSAELSGGRASGSVPYQSLHLLGGFATLRGYEVNEFPAREFFHLRIDDALGMDLFDGIPLLEDLDVQVVPFFDGAAILRAQSRDGRAVDLEPPDWRFAAGLGIQKNLLGIPGSAGQLRLDLARRLDRGDEALTARILFTTAAP
jgi:hypothetical protein